MAQKVYSINSSTADYNDNELQGLSSLAYKAGVFSDPDTGSLELGVIENGTPDMNVKVGAGKAHIEVAISGRVFKVIFENTAEETLAIGSNSSGSNRVDAVIARIDVDTEPDALKTNVASIEVVAGSGVSALSDSAIQTAVGNDGWVRLADVTVPDSAASITNGDITDTRVKVGITGAINFSDPINPSLTERDVTTGQTDQEQTTSTSTIALGEADTAGNNAMIGQSFVPVDDGMRGVRLWKKADTGTFTGNVIVELQSDAGGSPSGSVLATGTILNADWALLTDDAEFQVTFTSQYEGLSAATTYWVVVSSSTNDSANHPNIGSASGDLYANGGAYTENATDGWSALSGVDFYFKTLEVTANQIVKTNASGIVVTDVLPVGILFSDFVAQTVHSASSAWNDYMNVVLADIFKENSGIRIKCNIQYATGNQADEYQQFRVLLNGVAIGTMNMGNSMQAQDDATLQGVFEFYIMNQNSLSSQEYSFWGLANGNLVYLGGSSTCQGGMSMYGSVRGTGTIDTSGEVRVQLQGRNTQPDANLSNQCLGVVMEKIG